MDRGQEVHVKLHPKELLLQDVVLKGCSPKKHVL